MKIRHIQRWFAGAAMLFICSMSNAAGINFDSTVVSGCSLSGKTYTCAKSPSVITDTVTVAIGYAVISEIVADTVTLGAPASITGNVTANSTVALGAGAFVQGNLTAGTTVAIDANGYVTGTLSAGTTLALGAGSYVLGGASGGTTVALGDTAYVKGNLSSGTTMAFDANAYVTGNLSAGTTMALATKTHVGGNAYAKGGMDLAASAYISGNATSDAAITLATNAYVCGDMKAPTVTLEASASGGNNIDATTVTLGASAFAANNLTATTVTLAANAYVNGTLTGTTITLGAGACYGQLGPGNTTFTGAKMTCSLPRPAGVCVASPSTQGPNHILITHSGTALTCSAQTVVLTACADAACSSLYTGGVNVTLLPGNQVFAIGSSGVNNAATIQQTIAATVTLSATSSAAAPNTCYDLADNSSSCLMAVSDSGFLLNVPNHTAESTQIFTVRAVKADGSLKCVPSFASVSKTVNLSCAYLNPSSGTLPVRIGGIALASSASSSCTTGGANFTLNFNANGEAPVALAYADVGQLTLNATLAPSAGDNGLVMKGLSTFITAPASFGFSQVRQSGGAQLANPAPDDASGASFVKAGEPFSMTLSALNAVGGVTANFGKEFTPETATILLPTVVVPAGGANPPVLGALSAFTNGVASSSALLWNEAGIIALNVQIANPYGYLGASGTPNTLNALSRSSNVGRFIPAYFNTFVNSGVPMTCPAQLNCLPLNAFVYSRQLFGATVTAFSVSGVTTTNYTTASGLAKSLVMSAWDGSGSSTQQNPPATPSGNTLSMAAPLVFVRGIGSGTNLAYNFLAAYPAKINLASPTAIYVRAIDADAVSSLRAGASVEGGVMVVGGRFQTGNNYGSEVLPMWISMTAQFWDGKRYLNSITDSKSTFGSSDMSFTNCQKNLKDSSGCIAAVATAGLPNAVVLSNGIGRIRLNPVGAGNSGSVDVSVSAPSHLPATTARIVYGIFKSPIIYSREMYGASTY